MRENTHGTTARSTRTTTLPVNLMKNTEDTKDTKDTEVIKEETTTEETTVQLPLGFMKVLNMRRKLITSYHLKTLHSSEDGEINWETTLTWGTIITPTTLITIT